MTLATDDRCEGMWGIQSRVRRADRSNTRHTDLSVSRARVGLRLWSSCDLEMRAGWALQQTVVRTAARDIDRYFPLYYVLCTGPGTSGTW